MGPKNWVWDYFYTDKEHHGKNQTAYNAWCNACIENEMAILRNIDIRAATTGIAAARTENQLHESARRKEGGVKSLAGKPKQHMLPHLISCKHVAPAIQEQAKNALSAYETTKKNQENIPQPSEVHLAATHQTPGPSRMPLSSLGSFSSSSNSRAVTPAVTPTSERPTKRQKMSSSNMVVIEWNATMQKEFGEDLCKWLVATGSSWNLVNNPQTGLFFTKYMPWADLPDRRTLSGSVLDRLVDEVEDKMKVQFQGRMATGQCDGWKNCARQSIVASMVTVDAEAHLLRTHNVSADAKSGDNLLKLVVSDIEYAQTVFGLLIIAWCADDGGDARKMRRLLQALMPWLIVLLCWAHQINLTVGDLLKLKLPCMQSVSRAVEVVKWFNSHSLALGILAVEQRSMNPAKILALILPVITRWTAHYCSLRRLLELERPIKSAWTKWERELVDCVGKEKNAQAKVREIQDIVEDQSFWRDSRKVMNLLEPFAIAANITQGPTTRVYHVLLTIANLFRIFSDPHIEAAIRDGVKASLEKRWAAADQDVFIAGVVMNPYIRDSCFSNAVRELTPVGLFAIVKRVSERVLRVHTDSDFYGAFMDYIGDSAEFSREWMQLDMIKDLADKQGHEVDVVKVWRGIRTSGGGGRAQLVDFAIHILSVVANSAGCERAFSTFGIVHTKRRSRLSVENVRKTGVLRMDLKRAHVAAGLTRDRKRKFATFAGDSDSSSNSNSSRPQAAQLPHSSESLDPPASSSASSPPVPLSTQPPAASDLTLNTNDISNFDDIAQQLILDATESDQDHHHDESDSDELPPATLAGISTSSQAPTSTSGTTIPQTPPNPSSHASSSRPARKTSIPLSLLFKYPGTSDPWDGLDYYWKGGVKNLEEEMALHEELSQGTDDDADEA